MFFDWLWLVHFVLVVSTAVGVVASSGWAAAQSPIKFSRDIRPILTKNCFACHGPDEATREAGLALHTHLLATAETDSGEFAVVPGKPEKSVLLERVSSDDESVRMPPAEHAEKLPQPEIELLKRWIVEGANYESHWSYGPIVRPSVPDVVDSSWPRNPIDNFVLARLRNNGLRPTEEADKARLLRRLSMDLTGLPPTLAEQTQFLDDDAPDAYERAVDRLLNSSSYGEHWTRMWLDLARYADSQGYAQDELRTIWKYRDWAIDAFNRDLAFDQFTIEQLAGDLLPDPTSDQLIATAFHRNTMTNTEGGTDDEEFRHAAIVDRVNTTAAIWLATTVNCAQCHSHKFDPISHSDYYRFFALFNQTADNDQPDNSPLHETWLPDQIEHRDRIQQQIAAAESGQQTSPTEEQKTKLEQLKAELAAIQPITTPVMRELPPDQRRTTHIAVRGSFLSPGDVVWPGVPSGICGDSNESVGVSDRLQLAQWIVSPDNPLTARVAVNRFWEQLFGRGIVSTSDDFGSQGSAPSHPELLDWLAHEFVSNGWSMKKLLKLIVTSATYRQSSKCASEKLMVDPENRLLSRGARYRLSAEQIRDLSLASSGLLSRKMHGPPVYPPQPKSGLSAAFGGSLDWDPSPGEDRYRRGIYTLWRRTNPYPSFMALDATPRTVCTVRRERTNTPIAAFVTLNDPVFFECAQALARNVVNANPNADREQRLQFAFRSVVCRAADSRELDELLKLFELELVRFRDDVAGAERLANVPASSGDSESTAELAAWTIVANVLFNLDEVLTRN